MNIIIVSPSLNPTQNISGISSVTQFIIKNNRKFNYIHFKIGKQDNESGGFSRIIPILKSLLSWRRLISNYPNAIIHYNFPLSKASILRDSLFISIARIKKCRIIIHLHGGNFLTAPHIPIYLNIILKKIFSLPVPFIVLSELEKKFVQQKFKGKNIYILPNCIELDKAYQYRKEKNINNCLTIGYLGRIAETKGMTYLLNACIEMKSKDIPFILKIAGKEEVNNQYIPLFKKELGEHFIYAGVISGEEKNNFLKSLDIFILPSFFEGLPMSLIECMSFGVVPVTTPVGSIKEIIKNNINGVFIEVKDEQSIVYQINRLHNDRSLLFSMSKNSQNFIFQNFNIETYIQQLNFIYNQVK